ncbi:MAG: hypothetical protein ACJAQX_001738 [Polaribacter sp.]|jgi:hypothetical protein
MLSNKGENFKTLHFHIRNFKNWIKDVHSYCEKEYINRYIQEYFYRLNILNFRGNIFGECIDKNV